MNTEELQSETCLHDYQATLKEDFLCGKVAFITGGGSGIGFTITELLMRHGCDVAIASRNVKRLSLAKAVLEKNIPGRKCFITTCDVRKSEEVVKSVRSIIDTYGRLDILINNAAGNFLCLAENLSSNAFRNVLDIDTNGTFNVTMAVFQQFFKDNGGVIINITANLHRNGQFMQSHAGSAKAAIEALSKHLAVEWGQYGVRLVCVAPGPIGDTVGYSKLGGAAVAESSIAATIPLGRIGRRVDIGQMVLFLVSDAASFITGTTFIVDGGAILTAPNGTHHADALISSRL